MDLFTLAAELTISTSKFESKVKTAIRTAKNLHKSLSDTIQKVNDLGNELLNGEFEDTAIGKGLNKLSEFADKADSAIETLGNSITTVNDLATQLFSGTLTDENFAKSMKKLSNYADEASEIFEEDSGTSDFFSNLSEKLEKIGEIDKKYGFIDKAKNLAAGLGMLFTGNWAGLIPTVKSAGELGDTLGKYFVNEHKKEAYDVFGWMLENIGIPFFKLFDNTPKNLEEWMQANKGKERSEYYTERGLAIPKEIASDEASAAAMLNVDNPYAIIEVFKKLEELGPEISPEDFAALMDAAKGEAASSEALIKAFGSLAAASQAAKNALESLGRSGGGGEGAGVSGGGNSGGMFSGAAGGGGGYQEVDSWLPYYKPHAKGLWTVPYDDYLARLHRGERVLTASQARHSDNEDFSDRNTQRILDGFEKLLSRMQIVLNDKQVGRVVGDSVTKRVHKNISFTNEKNAYSHGR